MTVRLRALARLLRAVVHIAHGILIVLLRFRSYDKARRIGRIEWWSRKTLRLMGIALQVEGQPAAGGALMVANHISWLDITALHAVCPQARFVSKADVKHWPLLSHLADASNTLYLERERKRDALRVVHQMSDALQNGDLIAVFPEGTTSDGRRLLPFHANLLQAAIVTGAPVQPVALRFSDRQQPISAAVEFVGATTMLQSVWRVACGDGLTAHISLLTPRASANLERRALAEMLRADIAARLPQAS
jgi:1-acyl-sn-glycerol-3-phosphate acyltransferase